MQFNRLVSQTWALTQKNFTIAIFRTPISTCIQALLLPILILTLLLEIPNLIPDPNKYGVASPAKVASLADSMRNAGNKKLVVIQSPSLGPDFPDVFSKLTAPLDAQRIIHASDEDDLPRACDVNDRGDSNCYAAIFFNDSPKSGMPNATWNYTVKVAPIAGGSYYSFNPFAHDNQLEGFELPLQLAIDNAITNSTTVPEVFAFTEETQEENAEKKRKAFATTTTDTLSYVFFITMAMMCYHVSSMIVMERDSWTPWADPRLAWSRIASYMITFDLLYLPLWIILGCIFWKLFATDSSPAITIFWQILTGWAVTHASIFAAAFFRRAAVGTIVVAGLSYLLSILAAYADSLRDNPPSVSLVAILGLLFPTMNYTFFFDYLGKMQMSKLPLDLASPRPFSSVADQGSYYRASYSWTTDVAPYFLWLELVAQIIVFPLLAWVAEHYLHRISPHHRAFNDDPTAKASHAAIEATNLEKHYHPSIWRKLFCCCCCGARNPPVKAVNGLHLAAERNQILCLVGPNGSGKSTTLDMIAGFQRPTRGDIAINASPYAVGICPQKNILWDDLTVREHVALWNMLKDTPESPEALDQLIETCDLTLKATCKSKNLSGGMKRKLHLACMLVGGSSVCLMDEVTSGMDPISRRVIWNAILKERSKRTMVFTTHFLDECEVLSDNIVVLSMGTVKCQGTPAELKHQYGGGYRVHIPKTESVTHIEYPITDHGDHYICTTPDPSSAARVLGSFKHSGNARFSITGPTIEDVFLHVSADDPAVLEAKLAEETAEAENAANPISPRDATADNATPRKDPSFLQQMRALVHKRILILRSQWLLYLILLAVPIIVVGAAGRKCLTSDDKEYKTPTCDQVTVRIVPSKGASPVFTRNITTLAVGPPSLNSTLVDAARTSYDMALRVSPQYSYYSKNSNVTTVPAVLLNDRKGFYDYFASNAGNSTTRGRSVSKLGGIYLDNNSKDGQPPLLAISTGYSSGASGMSLMNLMTMARTGTPIAMNSGTLTFHSESGYSGGGGGAALWVIIFAAMMTFYPLFFALYPTYEKQSGVRALQYSNGVRTMPLWLSHLFFDFISVLIISIICTAIMATQAPYWGVGYLWFILALYGIAATITVYMISTFVRSQPMAFSLAMLIMLIEFIAALVPAMIVGAEDTKTLNGITYGLGLILPIENVIRAVSLSLNNNKVRCRGSDIITNPGSIEAYGGPILLLIVYIIAAFFLLIKLDRSTTSTGLFARIGKILGRGKAPQPKDEEKKDPGSCLSGRPDVDKEMARVTTSSSSTADTNDDLLRLVHLTKRFGSSTNSPAVNDVSLGLRKGEILALLGPNGAGKSTVINMIRGEVAPTAGSIYLLDKDTDVARGDLRAAQRHIGVCPQFDALDLLTVREHLDLYARCKGIHSPQVVDRAMSQVGLAAHAAKPASKLSGGMKRKLSLAIALLGDPPVLLVDEPSTAMDAAAKRVLWKTLQRLAPGRSVLLTTHSMEEADTLATRAAILSKRLLAVGTTAELREAYSNEYHVHLVLASAPVSSDEEMRAVEGWVTDTFPRARFEGMNLGGQVRFILPADSPVGTVDRSQVDAQKEDGVVSPITEEQQGSTAAAGHTQSLTGYLIDVLENNKARLGINCYSIGAATMERVFMSVVKESDAPEDDGLGRTKA
ncbi:hypothetical protein PG989_006711 [Apiospora arundinis]